MDIKSLAKDTFPNLRDDRSGKTKVTGDNFNAYSAAQLKAGAGTLDTSVISDGLKASPKGDALTLLSSDVNKEYDIEGTHFLRQTELMLQFVALWSLGESSLGLGLAVDLGVSFAEFQLKEMNSLRISECFKARAGVAVEVASWAQLQAGLGVTRKTVSLNYLDEDKTSINTVASLLAAAKSNMGVMHEGAKNAADAAVTADNLKKDIDFIDGTTPNLSGSSTSNFVMTLWARAVFSIPVNENFAVTLSAGVEGEPMESKYSGISLDGKDLTVGGSLKAIVSVGGKYLF